MRRRENKKKKLRIKIQQKLSGGEGGGMRTKSMQTSSDPLIPSTVPEEPFDDSRETVLFCIREINDCRT